MERNRIGLALGNPTEAGTALLSPESLSPAHSQTLADKIRGKIAPGQKEGGLLDAVLETATDPFFLLSVLTSVRFPVPKAIKVALKDGKVVPENWFAVSKQFNSAGKDAPLRAGWQRLSPEGLFPGTKAYDTMLDIVAARFGFMEPVLKGTEAAISKYERAVGRKFDQDDSTLLTLAMQGLHQKLPVGFKTWFEEKGVTGSLLHSLPSDPHFNTLVKDVKKVYTDAYKMMVSDPMARKQLAKALNAHADREWKMGLEEIMGTPGRSEDDLQKYLNTRPQQYTEETVLPFLEDFFPHYLEKDLGVKRGLFQSEIAARTLQGLSATETALREAQIMRNITQKVSTSTRQRQQRMLPSVAALERPRVQQYLKPGATQAIREKVLSKVDPYAQGSVYEYSTNIWDVTSSYAHENASTYAWTAKGYGDRMLEITQDYRSRGDDLRYRILMDKYVPMLLGQMTPEQAKRTEAWANTVIGVANWLHGPVATKVLPERVRKNMYTWLTMDDGRAAYFATNKTFTNYLYLSTLGLNPVAAAQNLMQTITTALPMGLPVMEGYKSVMKKGYQYVGLRTKGMDHDAAFRQSFPEYHEAGIPLDPEVTQTFSRRLNQWYTGPGSTALEKMGQGWGTVKDKMMAAFTGSELVNRLATFEAALVKGRKDLGESMRETGRFLSPAEQKTAVFEFARQATASTQMISGPHNTPYWLVDKPKLVSQLMTYPSRVFEYMSNTAWRVGSGQKAIGEGWGPLSGTNPGTFSRAYMYGSIAKTFASGLFGIDLSDAMLDGAMPFPRAQGPFAPLPFVPPAVGLVGAPLVDVAKGDTEFTESRKMLPLLVPGGVGLSKVIGTIPGGQAAAQAIGRRYVDYSLTTPDGRHPQYTSEGNLIGYLTPTQIVIQGLGLGRYTDIQLEQQAYASLLRNREKLRAWKRDYRVAILNGDFGKAQAVDSQFQVEFPGVSLKEMMTKQEFEAEKLRREIPRLEKILDTLPPDVRPMYAQAVQTAMLSLGPEFLNMPQGGLTSGATLKSRNRLPLNRSQNQNGTQALQVSDAGGTGAGFESLQQDAGTGFTGFSSF